ncbi:MAG: DUF1566 domain-containing protein [candidate division KSB1 bacterium]|nr:DUF1566 domain-containing protein [candidate division KSB1 bacterium]
MNQKKRCFVIMPFGKKGTEEHERNWKIYQLMIKPVVEACGYETIRSDELEHPGSITRDIIELLHDSDLVVADLSGWNANVFYELGVRHTLYRCGTIPIIRQGESLPFDIATYRAIFYSSELDGPEQFKRELKQRIKAFERIQQKKSDNPVHDVLGEKLMPVDLKEYVPRKRYEEKLLEMESLKKEIERLHQHQKEMALREKEAQKQITAISQEKAAALQKAEELKKRPIELESELQRARQALAEQIKGKPALVHPTVTFRSWPMSLSEEEVKTMLKKHDFFDSDWNKNGRGFNNQFKAHTVKGDQVVRDQASDLMWQQGGSSKPMKFEEAQNWVKDLNRKDFAVYHDWRLPTLEEAMSLMEPEEKGGLYIDPVFDNKQSWIWTSDLVPDESWAWVVVFSFGNCGCSDLDNGDGGYVRAVRSGQSSDR